MHRAQAGRQPRTDGMTDPFDTGTVVEWIYGKKEILSGSNGGN